MVDYTFILSKIEKMDTKNSFGTAGWKYVSS